MNVCYLGPLLDYSGYGEANRHDVAALMAAGVQVQGKMVSYVREQPDFGAIGQVIHKAVENHVDYRIQILHTTPDQYKRLLEEGKYHVGRFFWETDRVPQQFADGLMLCDEIWTGSQANKDAIEKAGVTKPVYIIPQAIETEREWPEGYQLEEAPDAFVFYSIFEWIDRKNPEALLRAYLEEFSTKDKVVLLLKTYFRDFGYRSRKDVVEAAKRLKETYGNPESAKILLHLELMDRNQIARFHSTGDCFVSAHRGEGWGLPQTEALIAGNPVISTGYGGVHEYLEDGKDAIILDYTMQPVRGMHHSSTWYSSDQNWAEIEVGQLRHMMRMLYDNRNLATSIGKSGQKTAKRTFNLEAVGKLLAANLERIESTL